MSFFSQPDGPVMGNGTYKSSVLIPGYIFFPFLDFGYSFHFCRPALMEGIFSFFLSFFCRKKEAIYLGPPATEKLPKVVHVLRCFLGSIDSVLDNRQRLCRTVHMGLCWLEQSPMENYHLPVLMSERTHERTLHLIRYLMLCHPIRLFPLLLLLSLIHNFSFVHLCINL